MHFDYYALFKDLFIEPNPVPAKHALALAGMMQPDVRLPLCGLTAASAAQIEATLRKLRLIPS